MIIRAYRPEDEETIVALRDHYHPTLGLPSRKRAIIEGVVEKEGRTVAYGVVSTFAEAVLVMDMNISTRDKLWVIRELMHGAIMGTRIRDLDELHVAAEDPKWAGILKQRFGFSHRSGEALVREV